ncbi:MAG TPA: MFS transporter [Acidimicrobiales bacterium]|nr:MFS transporter [Acidimicrobiales bacterium]
MNETADGAGSSKAGVEGGHVPEWIILALACVAQFMVVLDVSIVNVALPSIGRDLHYSPTGLQWVVNAYVLTFAGFLLLGGRAADLFGRRRVYVFGLALFTLASLAGGIAQNSAWLTAARAVQGIGGAVLSPATLTIIVTTFSGARMARALGIWSATAGAGGAVGSVLGGVLTAEISWRWVLFVNIPIGVVAVVIALWYLTELRREPRAEARSLDFGGSITVTAGLAALIYAIVGTDTHAWGSSYTLGVLGAAAVLLAVFVLIELKFVTRPLVPFRLFRSRSVTGANGVMLLVGAAFFSMWYFLSLYMQNVLGFSALRTGLAFLPMALAIVIGAQVSSRALPATGVRPLLLVGTVMAFGGFLWLSRIQAHSSYIGHVFGPGCLIAAALGVLFTPLASAATAEVSYTEAGLASGVLNTSRQVGGSIGLAVLATVAVDRTHVVLARSHDGTIPTGHATAIALTARYARAFVIAALLIATALVCSLVVPSLRSSPRRHSGSERETEADPHEAHSAPLPRGAGTAWEPEPA